jgi:uncharacterized membrane protein
MNFLKLFVPAFFIPMILDFVWLTLIAKPFYIDKLSRIGRIEGGSLKPVLWPVVFVYLFIALGIVHFAIPSAEASVGGTFLAGAILGLVIYGIYDFTNYSTLKDYPLALAFADIAWGTFLCGFTTMCTFLINRAIS